jgi:opacity protein-like surface antigen
MKKIVLAGLLASGLMAADSGLYVGVEYGAAKNSTTKDWDSGYSYTGDNNYKDVKFKVGSGTDGGVKFQGTLSLISFDEYVFSDKSKKTTEFGFDIIKEFEVAPSIYPFLKAGLGISTMDVEGYTEDSIIGVSFNLGAGVSYKVIDHLYLLAGVDYVGRKWQDIEDSSGDTASTTDSAFKPYVGVNYRF